MFLLIELVNNFMTLIFFLSILYKDKLDINYEVDCQQISWLTLFIN